MAYGYDDVGNYIMDKANSLGIGSGVKPPDFSKPEPLPFVGTDSNEEIAYKNLYDSKYGPGAYERDIRGPYVQTGKTPMGLTQDQLTTKVLATNIGEDVGLSTEQINRARWMQEQANQGKSPAAFGIQDQLQKQTNNIKGDAFIPGQNQMFAQYMARDTVADNDKKAGLADYITNQNSWRDQFGAEQDATIKMNEDYHRRDVAASDAALVLQGLKNNVENTNADWAANGRAADAASTGAAAAQVGAIVYNATDDAPEKPGADDTASDKRNKMHIVKIMSKNKSSKGCK